jgi:hypothetical protein
MVGEELILLLSNGPMAKRVWIMSGAAVVLAALVVGGSAICRTFAQLRTDHARPATYVPDGPIVVTALGKTFHRKKCGFIHGSAQPISAAEAIREGYTPCVRCMNGSARGGDGGRR